MDERRRTKVAALGGALASAAVLIVLAWFLPDGGLLGWVATAAAFLGVSVLLVGVPFALWAVVNPEAADRRDASSDSEPLPLVVPAIWWIMVVAWVFLLWLVGRPETGSDYLAVTVLAVVGLGAIAFALTFTRWYLTDRAA